ncbi:hypothetical protein PR048_000385 [Dryococelus australis]|uniref:Uncharacterized protein n=1 Tax=Dryococelus australis TaxID=614101 RepID=A0ABQ9IFS3_9NEOP|nr:hypothetical protein PR048_000385 [Dryococelus australis]
MTQQITQRSNVHHAPVTWKNLSFRWVLPHIVKERQLRPLWANGRERREADPPPLADPTFFLFKTLPPKVPPPPTLGGVRGTKGVCFPFCGIGVGLEGEFFNRFPSNLGKGCLSVTRPPPLGSAASHLFNWVGQHPETVLSHVLVSDTVEASIRHLPLDPRLSCRIAHLWKNVLSRQRGPAVSLLASHHGEPGSIPGRGIPGFSHVPIVPGDVAGRRVYLGISRSPRPSISELLHTHLAPPPSALKTTLLKPLRLRAAQISSLTYACLRRFYPSSACERGMYECHTTSVPSLLRRECLNWRALSSWSGDVLRAEEDEARCVWSSFGMRRQRKEESPDKTRRPWSRRPHTKIRVRPAENRTRIAHGEVEILRFTSSSGVPWCLCWGPAAGVFPLLESTGLFFLSLMWSAKGSLTCCSLLSGRIAWRPSCRAITTDPSSRKSRIKIGTKLQTPMRRCIVLLKHDICVILKQLRNSKQLQHVQLHWRCDGALSEKEWTDDFVMQKSAPNIQLWAASGTLWHLTKGLEPQTRTLCRLSTPLTKKIASLEKSNTFGVTIIVLQYEIDCVVIPTRGVIEQQKPEQCALSTHETIKFEGVLHEAREFLFETDIDVEVTAEHTGTVGVYSEVGRYVMAVMYVREENLNNLYCACAINLATVYRDDPSTKVSLALIGVYEYDIVNPPLVRTNTGPTPRKIISGSSLGEALTMNKALCAVVNNEVSRADEGEARGVWSSAGMQGRGKREIPRGSTDRRHRPARFPLAKISSERPAGSPWWEESRLTARPPQPWRLVRHLHTVCLRENAHVIALEWRDESACARTFFRVRGTAMKAI